MFFNYLSHASLIETLLPPISAHDRDLGVLNHDLVATDDKGGSK
jgi:hypothetical protein